MLYLFIKSLQSICAGEDNSHGPLPPKTLMAPTCMGSQAHFSLPVAFWDNFSLNSLKQMYGFSCYKRSSWFPIIFHLGDLEGRKLLLIFEGSMVSDTSLFIFYLIPLGEVSFFISILNVQLMKTHQYYILVCLTQNACGRHTISLQSSLVLGPLLS